LYRIFLSGCPVTFAALAASKPRPHPKSLFDVNRVLLQGFPETGMT
jgi:hypothetical protein